MQSSCKINNLNRQKFQTIRCKPIRLYDKIITELLWEVVDVLTVSGMR